MIMQRLRDLLTLSRPIVSYDPNKDNVQIISSHIASGLPDGRRDSSNCLKHTVKLKTNECSRGLVSLI